jgi:hypothetical protein
MDGGVASNARKYNRKHQMFRNYIPEEITEAAISLDEWWKCLSIRGWRMEDNLFDRFTIGSMPRNPTSSHPSNPFDSSKCQLVLSVSDSCYTKPVLR